MIGHNWIIKMANNEPFLKRDIRNARRRAMSTEWPSMSEIEKFRSLVKAAAASGNDLIIFSKNRRNFETLNLK